MIQNKGIVDPVVLIIIVVCFGIGGWYALKSPQIDSPLEQTAEIILKAEGIEIDFSTEKKREANAEAQVQREADKDKQL